MDVTEKVELIKRSPTKEIVKEIEKLTPYLSVRVLGVYGGSNNIVGQKQALSEGVDVMVALDVSKSMEAEDLGPSRLTIAKRSIERLIDQLDGDRIGLVIFGGDAFVQCPITTDYGAANLFLQGVNTGIIPVQGTAVGRAIEVCASGFSENSPASKMIVLFTDGESHEDDAVAAGSTPGWLVPALIIGAFILVAANNGDDDDDEPFEKEGLETFHAPEITREKIASKSQESTRPVYTLAGIVRKDTHSHNKLQEAIILADVLGPPKGKRRSS